MLLQSKSTYPKLRMKKPRYIILFRKDFIVIPKKDFSIMYFYDTTEKFKCEFVTYLGFIQLTYQQYILANPLI